MFKDKKIYKYLSLFDLQWRYKGKIIEKKNYILIVDYKWNNWKM